VNVVGADDRINVFDTSALIDLFRGGRHIHSIEAHLPEQAAQVYHPISLAEIGRRTHPEFWNDDRRGRQALEQRRKMLQLLRVQANRPEHKWWLRGKWRFTPYDVTWSHFVFLLLQTRNRRYLCTIDGEVHLLCHLTDHQIVSIAAWLAERGKSVLFVSGDRAQIEAAEMLRVRWMYTRDPAFVASDGQPFPWGARTLVPITQQ